MHCYAQEQALLTHCALQCCSCPKYSVWVAVFDELTWRAEQWKVRSSEMCADGTDTKIEWWHCDGHCLMLGSVLAVGLFLILCYSQATQEENWGQSFRWWSHPFVPRGKNVTMHCITLLQIRSFHFFIMCFYIRLFLSPPIWNSWFANYCDLWIKILDWSNSSCSFYLAHTSVVEPVPFKVLGAFCAKFPHGPLLMSPLKQQIKTLLFMIPCKYTITP